MKRFLLILPILCGCASYTHDRHNPDGSVDKTRVSAFLVTSAVKGFSSTTKDGVGTNAYSRTVRISALDQQTEVEKLGPIFQQLAEGLAEGAVKGAKPGL